MFLTSVSRATIQGKILPHQRRREVCSNRSRHHPLYLPTILDTQRLGVHIRGSKKDLNRSRQGILATATLRPPTFVLHLDSKPPSTYGLDRLAYRPATRHCITFLCAIDVRHTTTLPLRFTNLFMVVSQQCSRNACDNPHVYIQRKIQVTVNFEAG